MSDDETSLKAGDLAPAFKLPAINIAGDEVSSAALAGKPYVIYFYPKADTPGCTKEACGFQAALASIGESLTVIGVSKDTPKALTKFAAKYDLTFPLAADEPGETVEAYGTWVEKSMYGRTYMGIDRATFLVDGRGRIAQIWRKVKVDGHVEAVIAAAAALG